VDDYLNKLVIVNAQESDSGLYICFVTNSGGSFNYKPSYLRVYPAGAGGVGVGGGMGSAGDRLGRPDLLPGTAIVGGAGSGESTHVLALVVSLGVTVVLILVFIIVCVVRKSTKAAAAASPDSPEVVRNLMAPSRSTQSSSTITTVASNKFDLPLPPPPPSMWASASLLLKTATGGSGPEYLTASGSAVTTRDFASLHENSSTNLLSDRESPVSVTGGNQYEVPYCHSMGGGSRYSVPHPPHNNSNNSSSITPGLSEQGGYPFRHYPYFQYLNDYDSY
jgi:Na+-transporting methylmalonyl-CoA/oxaloacetate decarboxylase gamma subunit